MKNTNMWWKCSPKARAQKSLGHGALVSTTTLPPLQIETREGEQYFEGIGPKQHVKACIKTKDHAHEDMGKTWTQ